MKPNPFAIMAEQFDGSGLVFDPETNAAVSINKTGVFLWNLLKDGRSEQEMAAAILEHYDGVTPEKADADVRAFLDGLRERSLISDEG
jgi:hypothetical protein